MLWRESQLARRTEASRCRQRAPHPVLVGGKKTEKRVASVRWKAGGRRTHTEAEPRSSLANDHQPSSRTVRARLAGGVPNLPTCQEEIDTLVYRAPLQPWMRELVGVTPKAPVAASVLTAAACAARSLESGLKTPSELRA